MSTREFRNLSEFQDVAYVILLVSVWEYMFLFCRAMYAQMHLIRLADMKAPCMDKLHYYAMQTESMLLKYLKLVEDAKELSPRVQILLKDCGSPEYETGSDSDDDGSEDEDALSSEEEAVEVEEEEEEEEEDKFRQFRVKQEWRTRPMDGGWHHSPDYAFLAQTQESSPS